MKKVFKSLLAMTFLLTSTHYCLATALEPKAISQHTRCSAMYNGGLIHKAIPSCFSKENNAKGAERMFRWLFLEDYFKRDIARWFLFLEDVRPQLGEADFYLYKSFIHDMEKQPKAALASFKKSADLGNAEAAFYYSARTGRLSKSESNRYLKLAADRGFAYAQFLWGVNLLHGLGITENVSLGVDYIERAAYQGDSHAMGKLLEMKTSLDHDSFIFWHIVERIYLESDAEPIDERSSANYSFKDVKNWFGLCKKLSKAKESLMNVSDPSADGTYTTLMELIYRCLTVDVEK